MSHYRVIIIIMVMQHHNAVCIVAYKGRGPSNKNNKYRSCIMKFSKTEKK